MADSDSRSLKGSGIRGQGAGRSRLQVEVIGSARAPRTGLGQWLRRVAPAGARGAVTIAIVPDARVRALNRQYRKKDAATDVLSFPAGERGYLGDVVIAAGVARRQAKAAGHSLQTELRVLTLHGLLHLLGYDHEHDNGRMLRFERRLRARGGLREGLIERQAPRLRSGRGR
jgi:probable rRNA maturation factor